MKKIALMAAMAGLALGACAPRPYDDRDYRDRYYSDRYTPTPHGGLEYTDRDPYDPGRDRYRDDHN